MKKKAAKVRKRRKTSPYARAAEDFDPYDVQTETWNSGPTIVTEPDNAPGWWSRMWRRVFG